MLDQPDRPGHGARAARTQAAGRREEWSEPVGSQAGLQLLALEKRERFQRQRERIAGAAPRRRPGGSSSATSTDAEYGVFGFDARAGDRPLEAASQLDRGSTTSCPLPAAECLFNEGEHERARRYFERVLELRRTTSRRSSTAGVIRHERGRRRGRRGAAAAGGGQLPDQFLPHFSLGAVCAAIGEPALAAHLERRWASTRCPRPSTCSAAACYELGELRPAIERFLEDAVAKSPTFEEAHYLLGLVYLDRRWNRKALEAFRAAQRLNPRKFRYQDLVRYLAGHGASPLPAVLGDAAAALPPGRAGARGRSARRGLPVLPAGAQDGAGPPHRVDVLRPRLPGPGPAAGDRGVVRRVAGENPGEMLLSTAYAT
jgi:tetratricopeptide (TPR) repeat protein